MNKWSEWKAVAKVLDTGWETGVPWEVGVYRFRVRADHEKHPGEVVYVGRGGFEVSKGTSTICSRVGTFIAAAMGFWTAHSGGNTFRNEKDMGTHSLNVRDLEVSWRLDPDSKCAEVEEYMSYKSMPLFNRRKPHTCGRESCTRATKLRNEYDIC